MASDRRRIRVSIHNENPIVNEDGHILTHPSEVLVGDNGDYYFERVNSRAYQTKGRRTEILDNKINKINMNLLKFCEQESITESMAFYSGEIYISEPIIRTRLFPIKDIAILKKNNSGITNITSLSSVNFADGEITIPHEDGAAISIIYNIKRVSIQDSILLRVEKKNTYGIETL